MSETSPVVVGSLIFCAIFGLIGCAGTGIWVMRLNPGPAAKTIANMENLAAPSLGMGIPGIPDPTSLANSALTSQGGAAGLVGNALAGNALAGKGGNLVGNALSSQGGNLVGNALASKKELLGNNLETSKNQYLEDANDALYKIGAEGRLTNDLSIDDHDFTNQQLLNNRLKNKNEDEDEGWKLMKGGRKKTKTNRNPKLTNEPKVKQSVKRQRKPRTKKCLVTKGNQMYMSFCVWREPQN